MDSGTFSHVTGQKATLELLEDPHDDYNITTADGNSHSIDGIENVNVSSNDGPRIKLQNVLYVPSLHQNLMSVGSLTDTGLSMHFTNKNCFVMDKSPSILAIGKRDHSNGLYSFSQHSSDISINSVSNSSITELWHIRFGHLYYDGFIHLLDTIDSKVYLTFPMHSIYAKLA